MSFVMDNGEQGSDYIFVCVCDTQVPLNKKHIVKKS